jgi:hypothetical protein
MATKAFAEDKIFADCRRVIAAKEKELKKNRSLSPLGFLFGHK